jgi:hypothetical protein
MSAIVVRLADAEDLEAINAIPSQSSKNIVIGEGGG